MVMVGLLGANTSYAMKFKQSKIITPNIFFCLKSNIGLPYFWFLYQVLISSIYL